MTQYRPNNRNNNNNRGAIARPGVRLCYRCRRPEHVARNCPDTLDEEARQRAQQALLNFAFGRAETQAPAPRRPSSRRPRAPRQQPPQPPVSPAARSIQGSPPRPRSPTPQSGTGLEEDLGLLHGAQDSATAPPQSPQAADPSPGAHNPQVEAPSPGAQGSQDQPTTTPSPYSQRVALCGAEPQQ